MHIDMKVNSTLFLHLLLWITKCVLVGTSVGAFSLFNIVWYIFNNNLTKICFIYLLFIYSFGCQVYAYIHVLYKDYTTCKPRGNINSEIIMNNRRCVPIVATVTLIITVC
jgi:hypothetical protein